MKSIVCFGCERRRLGVDLHDDCAWVVFFNHHSPAALATNPGSWIAPRMINFPLPAINRVAAQTGILRQLANIASLTGQHTDESSSIPSIQSQQHTIDRFMLFRNFAVWMSLTDLISAVMKLSFSFLCQRPCPDSSSGQAYHECSSYFWTNPNLYR